jgi:hypothetical protein
MTSLNHSFFAATIALAPLVSQSRTPTATTSSVQSFTPRVACSDPRNREANPSCSLQFCTEIHPRGTASYCKFFTGFIPVSHSRTKKKKKRKEEEEVRPVACRCSAAMAGSYRRVTIPNKQGLELAGILEEAGKCKGEEEVCILCHGFRSSKHRRRSQSGTTTTNRPSVDLADSMKAALLLPLNVSARYRIRDDVSPERCAINRRGG